MSGGRESGEGFSDRRESYPYPGGSGRDKGEGRGYNAAEATVNMI